MVEIIRLVSFIPVLLVIYLTVSVGYLAILAMAGRFVNIKKKDPAIPLVYRRIAVFIPAYKEDGIIINSIEQILKSAYPRSSREIFVIADSFKEETLRLLDQYDVEKIIVGFDKSTKVKSLNLAFSQISGNFDIALICDADNIFTGKYLDKINLAFEKGARAVQTQRVAKNLNSAYAILDACSEGINNHIFRKGANTLGITSALIGSGMAFEYNYLKEKLLTIDAIGGFDKELQMEICRERIHVAYLEDALIFDEKIDNEAHFREQRKRWLYSQVNFLAKYFRSSISELFKGNYNYFHLGLLINLILPRAFYLLLFPLLIIFLFLVHSKLLIFSVVLFIFFLFSLFISIPGYLVNKQLANALFTLPKAILVMLHSALVMRKAKKQFIHTLHDKTEITNPLYTSEIEQL